MSNKKFVVDTHRAPRAIGAYSQAVGYEGLLFISMQTALDARTGQMSNAGVEQQTRTVMDHVQAILMAAGLDTSHVIRTTVYLRNLNDFDIFSDIYALYFDHSAPARSVIEVSRLPKDALVAIEAVAAAPADYTAGRDDTPGHEELEPPVVEEDGEDEAQMGNEDSQPPAPDAVDVSSSDVLGDEDGNEVPAASQVTEDTDDDQTPAPPGVVSAGKRTLPFGTIPAPSSRPGHDQEE